MHYTHPFTSALLGTAFVASTAAAAVSCKQGGIVLPASFGIEVLEVRVREVTGWTEYGPAMAVPPLPVEPRALDFCNVTVTLTHPGLNDTVNVYVWLPLQEGEWNGRFLGQGGAGFLAGGEGALGPGVALGYAAANTDAGHNSWGSPVDTMVETGSWSLTSPGNVNLVLLQDFGYRALDDLTQIAKKVVTAYYAKDAEYSYWHGCSTGGRQGLVLAQRYPDYYDGILAVAPAINWVTFLVTEYWPHVVMKQLDYYPPECELHAITAAAIEACDELDGVKDGMVAAAGLCKFHPHSVIGQKYDCDGTQREITADGAQVAAAVWTGPVKDGKPIWFGETEHWPVQTGLAATTCDAKSRNCQSAPFPISADWIKHFVVKDPSFALSDIDEKAFYDLLRHSRQQYHSLMDSADPDLRGFHAAGGKMITWHGLADQLIMPNGSSNYYERVEVLIPQIREFYRYFEVPGVAHCAGGIGAFPGAALSQLVDWVEKGEAPEALLAQTIPVSSHETPKARPICAYPMVAAFKGGNPDEASSFECAASFDAFGKPGHDEL